MNTDEFDKKLKEEELRKKSAESDKAQAEVETEKAQREKIIAEAEKARAEAEERRSNNWTKIIVSLINGTVKISEVCLKGCFDNRRRLQ